MAYQLQTDNGALLDAHFDLEGDSIVFHSRGGGKGAKAVNPDYSPALRLLLERLQNEGCPVTRAWVDSGPVQMIPIADRTILEPHEADAPAAKLVSLMATRMQAIGKKPTSKGGAANKRIRLKLPAAAPAMELVAILKAVPATVKKDFRSEERLPAEALYKVTAEHLWKAVEKLSGGFTDHGFDESDDFDVEIAPGLRLPPKALFGTALSEALGIPVKPKHFAGGENTPCFKVLRAAGYNIVLKDAQAPPTPTADEADREWSEGSPQLRRHLRRERAPGLREAKKVEFRRRHGGKLFCEKCKEDPVARYGTEHAEACIEVHHSKVLVSEMDQGHTSKLEDLECLCANCHRLEHRLLRQAPQEASSRTPTSPITPESNWSDYGEK